MPDKRCARDVPHGLIVLAGGESRRMRRNKALLPVPQGTLLERVLSQLEGLFSETLISVTRRSDFSFLSQPVIEDSVPGLGPMMGIRTCMAEASFDRNFVIACDIPDIDRDFLEILMSRSPGFDITIPVSRSGRPEPLFGVYDRIVAPEMDRLLDAGELSLLPLLERCRTRRVPLEDDSWLRNLNTREDYRRFLSERVKPRSD